MTASTSLRSSAVQLLAVVLFAATLGYGQGPANVYSRAFTEPGASEYLAWNIWKNGTRIANQGFNGAQVTVVSGTVVLDIEWQGSYNTVLPNPADNSFTLEFLLDGKPIVAEPASFVTGPVCPDPNFPVASCTVAANHHLSFAWNTTNVADGTHALTARVVSGTGTTYSPDSIKSMVQPVIVRNSGAINGQQSFYVGGLSYQSRHDSSAVEQISFSGSVPQNTPHPLNHTFVPPSSAVALRDVNNWMVESLTEARHDLYTGEPHFYTTQSGGVFAQSYVPEVASSVEVAYDGVERHGNFDGGRDANMADPYSELVAIPPTSPLAPGFMGVDLGSRIFKVDLTGAVTTIAGYQAKATALQIDYTDLTTTDAQRLAASGRANCVGSPCFVSDANPAPPNAAIDNMAFPNDLAFDTRNPNILYVADTGDNCINRVDLTTRNMTRYAGQCDSSGNTAGYVDGPALSAKFDRPYSVAMASDGTMYVADFNNSAIRKISPDGSTVSTLAGGTVCGNGACAPVPSEAQVAGVLLCQAPGEATVYGCAANAVGLVRSGNVVTAVFSSAHGLSAAQQFVIAGAKTGVNGSSFDGTFTVASVVSPTVITYNQAGVNDQSGEQRDPLGLQGTSGALTRDTWSNKGTVNFADRNAWVPYPQTVRVASTGDLVEAGGTTATITLICLHADAYCSAANTLRRVWQYLPIGSNAHPLPCLNNLCGSGTHAWEWLDVDSAGVAGPKDDVMVVQSVGNPGNVNMWRVRITCGGTCDPTTGTADGGSFVGGPTPFTDGWANATEDRAGHYAWAVAFSKDEGLFVTAGYGTTGYSLWKIKDSPVQDAPRQNDVPHEASGYMVWQWGTAMANIGVGYCVSTPHDGCFPWGIRPSFSSLHGARGVNFIGFPTFDDLMSQPRFQCATLSSTAEDCATGDANLAAYIQQGFGGSVPRPEITGNDLRNLIFFIRSNSLLYGSTAAVPYRATPDDPDVTPPVISNAQATRLGPNSVKVTWNTNKPTLGFVAWGTSAAYYGYSPIETCSNCPGSGGPAIQSANYPTTGHSVTFNGVPNAPLHLNVVAKDIAGNQASSGDFTVTGSSGGSNPPVVSLSTPLPGTTVSGTVAITATAVGSLPIVSVQFTVDGANLGAADTSAPYSVSWNTTSTSNGAHTIAAIARDTGGNVSTATASVNVNNGGSSTPPTVSILTPAASATVSGTVTLSASASSSVGLSGVQFQVDGLNTGARLTAAPYSVAWNTSSVTNGTHSISATATDITGNSNTTSISVTVQNGSGGGQSFSWTQTSNAAGVETKTWPSMGGYTMIWDDPLLQRTAMFYENRSGTIYENTLWMYDPIANNFSSIFPAAVASTGLTSTNIELSNSNVCAPPDPTVTAGGSGGPPAATYYVYITGILAGSSPPNAEYYPNYFEQKITTSNGQLITVTPKNLQSAYSSWNVYVSNASGTETLQASGLAPGTSWTMPASGLVAGRPLPVPLFPDDRQFDWQGTYDSNRHRFWLYGGACNSGMMDFWYFDSSQWAALPAGQKVPYTTQNPPPVNLWTRVADYGRVNPPTNPGQNLEATMAYIPPLSGSAASNGDKVYMYGGTVTPGKLWQYDPQANRWSNTPNCTGTGQPGFRDAPFMVWNPVQKKIYLFGGDSAYGDLTSEVADVYVWDPAANSGSFSCNNWSKLAVTVTPLAGTSCAPADATHAGCPPRDRFPAVAYDPSRNVFLVYFANTFWSDVTAPQTWKFDPVNSSWTQLNVSDGFTYSMGLVSSHALAYNSTADLYVMGQNINGVGKLVIWTLPGAVTGSAGTGGGGGGGGGGDSTPPTVSITTPAADSVLTGTIPLSATATDNVGVASVQFTVDGQTLGGELTKAPYTGSWNTTTVANGTHLLVAVARDTSGNTATSSVSVMVSNGNGGGGGGGDITPPTVSIITPTASSVLTGTITLSAAASDNVGVASVQFTVDGQMLGGALTKAPYTGSWNTTTVANGTHLLAAVARDTSGNTATSSVSVMVRNGNGGGGGGSTLSVTVTAPAPGTTVSGTVPVTASASDSISITGVQFQVDGSNLGTQLTTAPYEVLWNTSSVGNGAHTLAAIARDVSGNSVSASIQVNVSNTGAPAILGTKTDANTHFAVDVKGLSSLIACANCMFQTAADMMAGQAVDVMLRPGTNPPVADQVTLRDVAIDGYVRSVQGTQLSFSPQSRLWPSSITVVFGSATDMQNFSQTIQAGNRVTILGLLFKSGLGGGPTLVARKIALRH